MLKLSAKARLNFAAIVSRNSSKPTITTNLTSPRMAQTTTKAARICFLGRQRQRKQPRKMPIKIRLHQQQ